MRFTKLFGDNLLIKMLDKPGATANLALSEGARAQVLEGMPVLTGLVLMAGPGGTVDGTLIPTSSSVGDVVAFPPGAQVPVKDDAHPDDEVCLIPDSRLIGTCEVNPPRVPARN